MFGNVDFFCGCVLEQGTVIGINRCRGRAQGKQAVYPGVVVVKCRHASLLKVIGILNSQGNIGLGRVHLD